MRAIPVDYEPPENEGFDKFPPGKYTVSGFEFFTLNEAKKPMLKPQKDMKLVGRLRFNLVDGKQGPPFSLTLGEMGLLVKAFGKDPKSLPQLPELNQPGRITEYMEMVENICKGEVEVEVNSGGWVSSVKGMDVPADYFYFHLSDISPKDEKGNPFHKEGQYGHFFFAEFEVDFGEGGSETPYKGAKFTEIVSYAVEVGENGKPDWERTPVTGQYSLAGVRLSNLVRLTAPSMQLLEKDYDFSNPHNILPDWWKHSQQDKVMLKGNRAKNEDTKRIQLLWASLQAVEGKTVTKEESNLNESDTRARSILNQLFNYLAGTETVKNNELINPQGIEVARTYITPLKRQGKVKGSSFIELNYDEVMAIFNYVQEARDDEDIKKLKIALIHAGVGFEPPMEDVQDEWSAEETPFSF